MTDDTQKDEAELLWDEMDEAAEGQPPADTQAADEAAEGVEAEGEDQEAAEGVEEQEVAAEADAEIDGDEGEEAEETEENQGVTPEQLAKLEAQFKSEQARARSQQMRADRLAKRVAELEAKLAAEEDDDADSGTSDGEDDIDRLAEDYPDIAGPLVRKIKRLEQELSSGKIGAQEALVEAREELDTIHEQELERFLNEVPDGFDVVQQNMDDFLAWIEDQPKVYREIFNRNKDLIVDGLGAAVLVSRYKSHLAQAGGEQEQPPARKAQLRGAATPASRRVRPPTPAAVRGDVSPEEAWKYWEQVEGQ